MKQGRLLWLLNLSLAVGVSGPAMPQVPVIGRVNPAFGIAQNGEEVKDRVSGGVCNLRQGLEWSRTERPAHRGANARPI
ncbi:hypothetical protein J2046_002639 [Rhizobium petrolearium]|nr:hypothetical protein [Neorhizobium petrolearium]